MNAIPEPESTGFTLTIGGAAVAAPPACPVVNPIDESVVGHAPSCSAEQLDQAVSAAHDALSAWSATSQVRSPRGAALPCPCP